MQKSRLLLLIAIFIIPLLVFSATKVDKNIERQSDNRNGELKFASPGILQANAYLWGIERHNVSTPVEIHRMEKSKDLASVSQMFISGNASIADVHWYNMPKIANETSDFVILPYKVNMVNDFQSIYVRPNSDIDNLSDLQGKNVAYPSSIPHPPQQPDLILREEYGVEVNWVEKNGTTATWPNTAEEFVATENVDAVFIVGKKEPVKISL